MKGVQRGDDFKSPFVVPELSGHFEQPLIGFGAAVAEKNFSRPNQLHQRLSQPALQLGVIQVRNVDQSLRLLDQRFGDFRIAMAETAHRDAAAQVQIAFAAHVVNVTSRSVAEGNIEAPIARHHILLEQSLNGRRIVTDDCGERRDNLFHRETSFHQQQMLMRFI